MENRYTKAFRIILALTDLIIVNLCFYLGLHLTARYFGFSIQTVSTKYAIVYNVLWVILAIIFKLYHTATATSKVCFYKATAKVYFTHFVLFSTFLVSIYSFEHLVNFLIAFNCLLFLSLLIGRFSGGMLEGYFSGNTEINNNADCD
ncbi:MAG: hypothetical protein V4520_09290 [Bacteroidota bacterium]